MPEILSCSSPLWSDLILSRSARRSALETRRLTCESASTAGIRHARVRIQFQILQIQCSRVSTPLLPRQTGQPSEIFNTVKGSSSCAESERSARIHKSFTHSQPMPEVAQQTWRQCVQTSAKHFTRTAKDVISECRALPPQPCHCPSASCSYQSSSCRWRPGRDLPVNPLRRRYQARPPEIGIPLLLSN